MSAEPASETIRIRAYEPGDEHGLAALFGRCFGREISARHWLWKLKQTDAGYENVWVVTAGEAYVGQYVGVPVEARVQGRIRPAIVVGDTMVDPSMRRRGVLTRMGRHAHESWRRAGVCFAIGLPNEQWGSRAGALGWEPLFPLRWMIRVLRPEAVLARRLGLGRLARMTAVGAAWRRSVGRAVQDRRIAVDTLRAPSADLDAVAEKAADASTVSLARGASWIERRYMSCPSTDYEVLVARRDGVPLGYAVYRMRGGAAAHAVVAELVADGEAAHGALAAEIERRALAAGADAMTVLAVPGTADYRLWKRCGFFPRTAAFTLQFVPLQTEMRRVRGIHAWRFMGGDFDVV